MRPRVFATFLSLAALLVLAGCPTRIRDDAGLGDAAWDVLPLDPRVPNVGAGDNQPSCAPEAVIDVNELAFRDGNMFRIRVDTHNRRNELHPECTMGRDSTEAVLRYTAPDADSMGNPRVRALRVSTVAPATEFDTVLSVRNDCGPEYHDYSCNNDGFLDDGTETRRSTVYFVNVEPLQFVYVVVDGFDGSEGVAEVSIEEFPDIGTLGAPCIPVPPSMQMDPNAEIAGFRCPNDGIQCRPGAAADGTELCLPLLGLGAPCDPEERRNVCEPFSLRQVVCAQNPVSRTEALCALPGTAPGALCRPTDPRCDGHLACSPGAGFSGRDICVPLRSLGASCDPTAHGYVDQCEMGLRCCGDSPDAGASFYCRPAMGYSPCFDPAPEAP
jgi:hypothetical protein